MCWRYLAELVGLWYHTYLFRLRVRWLCQQSSTCPDYYCCRRQDHNHCGCCQDHNHCRCRQNNHNRRRRKNHHNPSNPNNHHGSGKNYNPSRRHNHNPIRRHRHSMLPQLDSNNIRKHPIQLWRPRLLQRPELGRRVPRRCRATQLSCWLRMDASRPL
ncbi:hypothetical protein BCR33DRAFT_236181 [Rhizoclosmatium globosum]|uniref:Uncharacterized protein n=1 Tax=Rhizoclosmatium globosum TaxID=329046 RepID=A0A1Y2CAS6_9FUNG|nr:hypothetical protein BCR33DRAFT_236181 [Rhizoclosmatium globosum]|eukprot:ORY44143.1 hypothetical protein BCR33DRAFT_236181 [Rhizoclosmatium globosum]